MPQITKQPTRPAYSAGELVDYTAQTGDNLQALAIRFNTSVEEIREANPELPEVVTTLPPSFPMKIPIYYQALWGSSYLMLPDSLFINGPAQIGFDTVEYVNSMPGWFKNYTYYAGHKNQTGGELIEHIAKNFSISPRLLLTILEYQCGALTQSSPTQIDEYYPLGLISLEHQGYYLQLVLAANTLNNGYYGWREGKITSLELQDGKLEIGDPWLNAATFGLHYLFSQSLSPTEYEYAVENQGFSKTYEELFSDPWENAQYHIPGSLTQPEMRLPFAPGKYWAYTGGPHTGWGKGYPYAALDFAPPSEYSGCIETLEWGIAVAGGVITRSAPEGMVIDLDGDGDERTGWTVIYLHLATKELIETGSIVSAGDPLGHPSCEGGESTGTHLHLSRKYNGEWVTAGGALPFTMEGWIARDGDDAYSGYLDQFSLTIRASVYSDKESQLQSTVE